MGSLIPHDMTEMPNMLATPSDACPDCKTSISQCAFNSQIQDDNFMQVRVINIYYCPICQDIFGIVVGYRTYHTLFEN